MPLSDILKTLIRSAWDDGYPLLVAASGPLGPNIAPKGSTIAAHFSRAPTLPLPEPSYSEEPAARNAP